jgi:hypothetical protein
MILAPSGYTAILMTINLNTDFLVSGWSIRKKRIILSGGRRDIEQIGASLTTTNDVLGGVLLHHPFFRPEVTPIISTLPMLASKLNLKNLTFNLDFLTGH